MTDHAPGAVLVTGAASGIGRATAILAAQRGYDVLALDRDDAGLDRLAADVKEQNESAHVVTVRADVTDDASLAAAVTETRQDRAPLTAAVSCAGIEVLDDILSLSAADWQRCLDVNLTGTFNTVRAALPELLETRGAVVMVASDAGITGATGYAAYCASKHGVVGLMKAIALDLGPRGIRVNAVAPGFVETPMAERIFDGDRASWEYYQGTVPLGRFAHPEEVAKAVLHLAGEESSYVTGAVHSVDGGSTAGYFTNTERF
ncbi:SDR family NAD(P)-dependent oxidoreductase [Pedococcus sp. NPDC057267]|uniref:SDR family NAD(P)-dependent oxidoreductase n=1 Tax=Pedococcus sp. NPDC057267 TaxID=3346077 RepID=UPI00363B2ADE